MKLCPICATSYPASHRTCPTHGTVLVDTPELPPGTMIRDCYRIERTLGKGGMGIVYLAEHTLMGEPRALKFLSSALASNPTFVQRFLQEARAASKLRHPNIAATLELGQSEDGSFYISMEYVDGPSLRAVIEQFPRGLPVERACAIARGVAEALAAAHANRLVHRDIKPENVLLSLTREKMREGTPESEIPKVVDFGIVAISDGVSRLTQTGRPLLTAEQWRGSIPASELDGRTDLYSLGCMFFEMLTGQLPFHAETYEGWFEKHVYAMPPTPSYFRPELTRFPWLDSVVLHLLAKEREQRTANVHEFLTELDRALHGSLAAGTVASHAGQDPSQRRQTMFDTSEPYGAPYDAQGSPIPAAPLWQSPSNSSNLDTFGTPRNQPAPYSGGNGADQIPAPVPIPIHGQRIPPKPSGLTRYRGVLFGALGAFMLIILGAIALVVWQRREEAARQSQTAQAEQADQISAQRSIDSQAQPNPTQSNLPQANPATQPKSGRAGSNQPNSAQTTAAKADLNPPPSPQPKVQLAAKLPVAPPTAAEVAEQGLAFYRQQQYAQAEPLLAKSCNLGQGNSCDYLGRMYQHKQGVEQDYKRAWSLYSEGCDDGSFQSCDHLASMYNYKLGIAQDYPRAATLYGKACNGGVLEACNDLGFMYQMKQGVEQDYPHALMLYQRACDGGVALACNNLGIMYQDKEGVEQNYARAATYYTKACEGGNPRGCSDLGDLYRSGYGVPKDADKARTYLSKGCSMGNQWGCDRLKQVQ
jgi:uncharacterized protein